MGEENHSDKLDRIRDVAMTVREPRTAGDIAESASVARNTAEKYLRQLVEADKVAVVEQGRETRYYPDPVTQYFDRIRELVENHDKTVLTDELAAIRDDIDEWEREYDVSDPDELRASIGDGAPSREERERRRRDAEDWEYYEHQAELIQQALQLYDSIDEKRGAGLAPAP